MVVREREREKERKKGEGMRLTGEDGEEGDGNHFDCELGVFEDR